MSMLIVCRACTRNLSVIMFVHLQWIQKQIMHGSIWGFLWGISIIKSSLIHLFEYSRMKFVYIAAVLLEMTCWKHVIPVIWTSFRKNSRFDCLYYPVSMVWDALDKVLMSTHFAQLLMKNLKICRSVDILLRMLAAACKSFEDEAEIYLAKSTIIIWVCLCINELYVDILRGCTACIGFYAINAKLYNFLDVHPWELRWSFKVVTS